MCGGGDDKIKETPEQRELAKIAAERFEHAEKFEPYQQMYMDRVDNLNSESSYDQVKGQTNLQYQKAFADAQDDVAQNVGQVADPSTGKFQSAMQGVAEDQGQKTGDAMTRTDSTQFTRYAKGLGDVVAMGQGKAADAQMGLTDVAQASQGMAYQDAQDAAQKNSIRSQAVGTGLGLATRAGMNHYDTQHKAETARLKSAGKYLSPVDSM